MKKPNSPLCISWNHSAVSCNRSRVQETCSFQRFLSHLQHLQQTPRFREQAITIWHSWGQHYCSSRNPFYGKVNIKYCCLIRHGITSALYVKSMPWLSLSPGEHYHCLWWSLLCWTPVHYDLTGTGSKAKASSHLGPQGFAAELCPEIWLVWLWLWWLICPVVSPVWN